MADALTPGRQLTPRQDGSIAPGTPTNSSIYGGRERDQFTPLRKAPLPDTLESMLKLTTDNKISAQNSWELALIDYFHDMRLLKDGDSVNFQRASCTLDGCVKIYTTRVDSVATETGKLLSGLADNSTSKKGKRGAESGEGNEVEGSEDEGEGEDEGNGEGKRKRKKRAQRSSESTLVKDFSQIQIKKLDLEFSVDPLFKKASADFDEGGAKGLLLNHLSIDSNGRIVFDSSEDIEEPAHDDGKRGEPQPDAGEEMKGVSQEPDDISRKLASLKSSFLPDFSKLESLDICPTLKHLDLSSSDGAVNAQFLKALEGRKEEDRAAGNNPNNDPDPGNDIDLAFGFDDGYGAEDDTNAVMAFGEGGEAWANETVANAAQRLLSPSSRTTPGTAVNDAPESGQNEAAGPVPAHDDILSYFDEAIQKNWKGPEHWRIRRNKDTTKPAPVRQRKEKEVFEIDFLGLDGTSDEMMSAPKTMRSINMPKKRGPESKSKHLLPLDKPFSARQLVQLFIKPDLEEVKGWNLTEGDDHPLKGDQLQDEPVVSQEDAWAAQNMAQEELEASSTPRKAGDAAANYDANFFNDENLNIQEDLNIDDDDAGFSEVGGDGGDMGDGAAIGGDVAGDVNANADATHVAGYGDGGGAMPLSQMTPTGSHQLDFGSQILNQTRRTRPDYVQYARVAKKVDVRMLKENIWAELKFEGASTDSNPTSQPNGGSTSTSSVPADSDLVKEEPRKFTQIINDLRSVYPEKAMSDISTSYCFICVLHLANEKGLEIQGDGEMKELMIKKDLTANEADAY